MGPRFGDGRLKRREYLLAERLFAWAIDPYRGESVAGDDMELYAGIHALGSHRKELCVRFAKAMLEIHYMPCGFED